jgi:signal transduction histidine kinase
MLNHDGQLQLENYPEQGAIATVTLPLLQKDDE